MTDCSVCTADVFELCFASEAVGVWLCINGHRIVPDREAPCMAFMPYGPAVPTPEDILRSAGLEVWI